MGGTHSCSRASLPMRWSVDGRHPLLLTCLSAHAMERGWEAPTLAHVPLCPCAGAWMGGTHSCSRVSLPMRWSVDGRHPLLLTCLSCPCDGAWMAGTHSCSRASLPMRWSVDGRHPLLLMCSSAHALEHGWEAPTLAHAPLCPCPGAWMGGTHSCSRASLPMRRSVDGRHPLLLTCLSAHALERGWKAPTLAHVSLCPCAGARMGGTHSCSRASLPMRWSVDGRHPLLLTCLSAHALERGWEAPTLAHVSLAHAMERGWQAPTLAHVPLCPCAGAWMGGTHSCSCASLPMHLSMDGRHPLLLTCLSAHAMERGWRHPLLLTCLSAHAMERGWEAPTLAHVPLCPCAGAWMGGTHSCSRVSLPMRWSVDGRHPLLLTCLSAHAMERGWQAPTLAHVPLCPCAGAWMGGTHSCSCASLPMHLSMDGRHPLLLTYLSAHALERGWEAPTLAHVPLCPCAGAWMGGTHSSSRASLPMRSSVDGRHPLLLTCLSAHALERGWEAPTLAHVSLCPCARAWMGGTHSCSRASLPCDGAWMGGTHSCSRVSLPMRWSVDGRHPLLLTCLSAHALERGWEAPTLAHVPLCPCAGAWMGGTHSCSRASLPMRWSVDGRHPLLLTCLSAHALERGWEAPTLAHVPLCPCARARMGGTPLLLTCLSAHAMERGWEAPTLAHVRLCPCAGAWMGGTHSCSRVSLPMQWSVDGRHPLLLTCLSAHALERGWEAPTLAHVPLWPCAGAWMGGTHSCSRVSLPMRWSVDGRHPLLLTCLSAHALERGWEAPTLAHVSLCPCAGAWMGGTHSCSRVSLPMQWSVDGRHPLLLTCLSAHALERAWRHPLLLMCLSAHALEHGWEAPTLAHVPLCPCAGAWMGGTHSCSRASLPMRRSVDGRHPLLLTCLSAHALERGWEASTLAPRASLPMRSSVDGRHPLLLTCLSAHAMERGWEAPTLAHVSLCPCAGAWMGGTHSCSRVSLPMRSSADGRHPLLLTCLSAHAMERGWEAPTLAHVPLCPCT